MKINVILLVLLVVALSLKTNAQNIYVEDNQTFYGGLVAGAALTQIDGDKFKGYRKIGFTGGGIVYAELAPEFALSMEILYTQKGSRDNVGGVSSTSLYRINSYEARLDYAEVPILVNYFVRRKSHFGAGFSYGQVVSGKEIVNTTPDYSTKIDLEDYPFRKYDINFIMSGNIHIKSGFFLNLRFQYSVVPMRVNPYLEFSAKDQQFNNMLVLRLMYLF